MKHSKLKSTIHIFLESLYKKIENYSGEKINFTNLILDCYYEKHRYYHNLNHVFQVARFCKAKTKKIDDEISLQLAAWFHDIIYDPSSNLNEEKSSEILLKFFEKTSLNYNIVKQAAEIILASKNHLKMNNHLEKIFYDADLYILSASSRIYKLYAKNIRKEYQHINDYEFYIGRKKFIENLLDYIKLNQKLYFNLNKKLSFQAKYNLNNELKSVNRKLINLS